MYTTLTNNIPVGTIDYTALYFKYKTATPIRGEPISKTLKKLWIGLRTNANSIKTDLGGENYDYFGLVSIDEGYVSILNIESLITPSCLLPLVILPNTISI